MLLIASVLAHPEARAVLFYATADATKNTTVPTGELTGSGWQWQGYWGGFTGTPIGPHHFLTAKHVGGAVGGTFTFNGTAYTTTARTPHPQADLTVWQVTQRFPTWARLYTATDEVGKPLVVFGRGRLRGTGVTVPDTSPTTLRGWRWGTSDGKLRWGENRVDGIHPASAAFPTEMLYASFDREAGINEATLATGDSGGGVFIRDGTTWKLAGINLTVDGSYSLTGAAGTWFSASIFDAGGLHIGSDSWSSFIEDAEADLPGAFYAARLSTYAGWIATVAPVPAPPTNDDFANATESLGMFGVLSGSNFEATKEPAEPDHAGDAGGRSVWWRWTAPWDGCLLLDTFGSDFNTVLAAYTGSSTDALTLVAANDDTDGSQSAIAFDVVEGTTYSIAVDGYQGSAGNIVVHWSSCVTLDDNDPTGVSVEGSWAFSATVPDYWDAGYLHDSNTGKGSKSVRFQPNLVQAGLYQVAIWYTAHSARARNVPVDIVHDGGATRATLNQRLNGSQWVGLGSYRFAAGTAAAVVIRTTGTDGVVVADAVRFCPLPDVTVDDNDPIGVSLVGSWALSTTVPDYWDAGYLHDGNTGKGSKSVRFQPNLAQDGPYEVAIWYTAYTGRASNVPVDIVHNGGTTTVILDQRVNGSRWVGLGAYDFAAGPAAAVVIRTTGTDGVVVADAVRFHPAPDLTVDDNDPTGVNVVGSWALSTTVPNHWDAGYLHDGNTGKGSKSVRFQPNLLQAGLYEVAVWYTAYTGRASNVPVDIVHNGGTTTATVNQRINGSQWNSLGTFAFNEGSTGSVLVRTTGTDGVVVADAVRFTWVGPLPATPGSTVGASVASPPPAAAGDTSALADPWDDAEGSNRALLFTEAAAARLRELGIAGDAIMELVLRNEDRGAVVYTELYPVTAGHEYRVDIRVAPEEWTTLGTVQGQMGPVELATETGSLVGVEDVRLVMAPHAPQTNTRE